MARPSSPHLFCARLVRRAEARRAAAASGLVCVPFRRGAAVAVAALALAGPAAAQQTAIPAGVETRVNATAGGDQQNVVVARSASGASIAVWQSPDGDGDGIYAQRYLASGAVDGGEFRVNTTTTNRQFNPSVSLDADGDALVAWESLNQDGSGSGIYAQRYAAGGAAVGGEVRVNTYTTVNQGNPSVALDADGDALVAWQSYQQDGSFYGVYARRYTAAGVPSPEFRVTTYTAVNQGNPSVALDADGDALVAWQSYGQDSAGYGAGYGVYAQRYAASGAAVGGEVRVNTFTATAQLNPSVSLDADGDALVAWQSYGQDGAGYSVYAQRYEGPNRPVASGGTPAGAAGGEVTVAGGTATQTTPAVASEANGDYVVTWTSTGRDASGLAVVAQRYTAAGVARGAEFVVNTTTTTGDQQDPSVAMDADGDFVVAWEGTGQGFSTSTNNVYARRYDKNGVPQGGEFGVQSPGSIARTDPSVGMDADGDFVVTWQTSFRDGAVGLAVVGQRYNAAGAVQGGEFVVNTFSTGDQSAPSVSLDADGDFVVAWQSAGQDGAGLAVFARRYDNAGVAAPQGEFRVNTYTTSDQQNPSVDLDADGDFVVAWESNGQDDFGLDVFAQRYNRVGVAQGTEFLVNTSSTNARFAPSVGLDADGDFAVTWTGVGQDGDGAGVYARRYGALGTADGAEFRVNTTTTGDQTAPGVALDDTGDMVVAWQGAGSTPFSGTDVFAQRFAAAVVAQTAIEFQGAQGWRTVAAPTATATVGDVLGPVWTQGFPGADSPAGGSNVFRYTEAALGTLANGYVAPASAGEVMGSGRGYFAYVYADDDLRASAPGVQGGFPKALSVVGDAPVGDIPLPVTYTNNGDANADGWNLAGNPYRASIDWDLVTKADVSAAVYVYDNRLPGYRVWNGVAGDLERGVVTAGQGFWAKAMDTDASGGVAPSAVVPVAAQVTGDGQFYGRGGEAAEASSAPVVALRLTRGAGGTGNEAAAFVAFVEGASAGMDAWDAYALAPAATTYASLSTTGADGTALAIQALPLVAGRYALDLSASAVEGGAPAGGAMTLSWDGAALPEAWTARLVDSETGASADLTAAGTYAFEAAVRSGSADVPAVEAGPPSPVVQRRTTGRFSIVVEAQAVGTEGGALAALSLGVSPNPVSSGGVVRVTLPEAGVVRVVVYDVLGRQVAVLADEERAVGEHAVSLGAERFAPGVYVVRVTAGEASVVRRVTVAR